MSNHSAAHLASALVTEGIKAMIQKKLLRKHPCQVAKEIGGYRRIGKHLQAYVWRSLTNQEIGDVCKWLRCENERQSVIRRHRRACRHPKDSLSERGSGWAINNWNAQKMFAAFEIDRKQKLEREVVRRAEQATRAAALAAERRRVFAALRKLGFVREYTSGKSAYYRCGPLVVRVSDHEVPMTDERRYHLDNGGHTWANSRFSLVVGEDENLEEWMEGIRERLVAN